MQSRRDPAGGQGGGDKELGGCSRARGAAWLVDGSRLAGSGGASDLAIGRHDTGPQTPEMNVALAQPPAPGHTPQALAPLRMVFAFPGFF